MTSRTGIIAGMMAALFVSASADTSVATPQQSEWPQLFIAAATESRLASRELRAEVASSWRGALRADLLQASTPARQLRLTLPDGRSFDLLFDEYQDDRFNGQAWIGWVDESPRRRAILVVDGNMVTGHVALAHGSLEIRPLAQGGHAVDEIIWAALPAGAAPVPAPAARETAIAAPGSRTDDGSIFDVLVLYTRNTVAGAGSAKAMRNLIKLGVAETNVALADSKAIPRIRLIKHAKDPYVESRVATTDLDRLARLGDGHWNKVDSLRDRFGADFVVGIVELISIGGIANVMQGVDPDFAGLAVSIVRRLNISPGYSFAHELGHNFGLLHARTDSSRLPGAYAGQPRAYKFSYGYDDVAGRWRTVMAQQPPGVRILNFSNHRVKFEGRPTGVKQNRADSANASLSISRARKVLANFRGCAKKCD